MKLKSLLTLAGILALWTARITAQTNGTASTPSATNFPSIISSTNPPAASSNTRIVNGQIYDIFVSRNWTTITLPEGSSLLNENKMSSSGNGQPMDATFSVPIAKSAPKTVIIHNFPFDSRDFFRRSPNSGLETRYLLRLRVFPLDTKTNWTANGEMRITLARPIFDYGLPYPGQ